MLTFAILGLEFDEELMNMCTEAYIKVYSIYVHRFELRVPTTVKLCSYLFQVLAKSDKLIYIPYYVQQLSASRQIPAITEQIDPSVETKRDSIEFFLRAAQINNLDILNVGIAIVEKLRTEQEDFDAEGLYWITCCYNMMEDSDSSEVMLAYLRYTLIITRKFLILGNIKKSRQLIREVRRRLVTCCKTGMLAWYSILSSLVLVSLTSFHFSE
jgi:hypothetical protein